VAANKIDALDDPARADALAAHARRLGLPFHRVSGVTGAGVAELLEAAWPFIAQARANEAALLAVDAEPARIDDPAAPVVTPPVAGRNRRRP
jgi:hypothetical protein